MEISFFLNDSQFTLDCEPETRLSVILKKAGKIKSIREGCQRGRCGSCLVLMNNNPVYSCLVPVINARDMSIITIEWALKSKEFEWIEQALKKAGIHLCPQCAPPRILTILSLLYLYTLPDKKTINETLLSVTCSCVGFNTFSDTVERLLKESMEKRHG